MKTEREYLVALYSFLPFGPARTQLLIKYFKSAKNAWNADKKELLDIGLKQKIANDFVKYRKEFDKEYFNKLKELGINFVTFNDKNYPQNLKGLDDLPLVLYYSGSLNKSDNNAVAIVGARKMTTYGKEIAYRFSSGLASRGVTIVSGLALGVDAVSHKAALEAGGRTLAVIASGMDNITPVTNRRLAKEFVNAGQGSVISEFPLGHMPQRHDFAVRNRIISGLSRAIVVIEGERKSGTLLTASHAAEQGKQVFAVPGQITSPMSGAPHFLLKNGAHMATSVDDILEELDLQLQINREEVDKIMPEDETEIKLIEIITNEPLHLDEIVRRSKMKTNDVASKLSMMEIKGLVKNLGGGVYKSS